MSETPKRLIKFNSHDTWIYQWGGCFQTVWHLKTCSTKKQICPTFTPSSLRYPCVFFQKINESQFSDPKQVSLYYKPKQCTFEGQISQNYHMFALFYLSNMGVLYWPSSPEIFSSIQRTHPRVHAIKFARLNVGGSGGCVGFGLLEGELCWAMASVRPYRVLKHGRVWTWVSQGCIGPHFLPFLRSQESLGMWMSWNTHQGIVYNISHLGKRKDICKSDFPGLYC